MLWYICLQHVLPNYILKAYTSYLPQILITLNIIHPFEYDDSISAYQGVHGTTFNFNHHPIAPLGYRVLTWDSPDNRRSWSDNGIETIYIGPALDHFRAFNVWIPTNSASRVSNTVWWFMKPFKPSLHLTLLPKINRGRAHIISDGNLILD